jgi:DNA (cytosine-5)-methyltransferase 1
MGFDARWGVLGAADVGAPHQRDRIWIKGKMAYTKKLLGNGGNDNPRISMGGEQISEFRNSCWSENVAYSGEVRLCSPQAEQRMEGGIGLAKRSMDGNWWAREPGETPRTTERGLGRVADGVASRVDRLKAIGNGQVPEVARTAWEKLNG